MNTSAKGRRNEHRSMQIFESLGYETLRSAASLSIWDFHAWNRNEGVYVQVRTRDWPGLSEMELYRDAVVPKGSRKIIHRWRDRQKLPDVKEV